MDIYCYLNSKDVADYCRSIHHQFDAKECVFIIFHCNHISVEEKNRLYQEIIDTMPDIILTEKQRYRRRDKPLYPESLFAALREYIADQQKMLEMIRNGPERAVYRYFFYEKNCSEHEAPIVFSSYTKAKEAFLDEINDSIPDSEIRNLHILYCV